MASILGNVIKNNTDKVNAVSTIPRFTYRRGFQPLKNEYHFFSLRSDTHWGCCIRCGQSLLCQYIKKFIEFDPIYYNQTFPNTFSFLEHFNDTPTAPFSIHNFCKEIIKVGGHEGKWVSPSKLSFAIMGLLKNFGFPAYVAENGTIVKEDVLKLFEGKKTVLCLIPLLCGDKTFDTKCYEVVGCSVSSPYGLGFIGGVKNKAHYYVGVSRNKFYFFDPHTTQNHVLSIKDHDSYFHQKLKSINVGDISPSLALGFAWKSPDEFEETVEILKNFTFCPISFMESRSQIDVVIHQVSGNDQWDIIDANNSDLTKSWKTIQSVSTPEQIMDESEFLGLNEFFIEQKDGFDVVIPSPTNSSRT